MAINLVGCQFPAERVDPECTRAITRRIGYRYQLLQVRSDRSVTAGRSLRLDLTI